MDKNTRGHVSWKWLVCVVAKNLKNEDAVNAIIKKTSTQIRDEDKHLLNSFFSLLLSSAMFIATNGASGAPRVLLSLTEEKGFDIAWRTVVVNEKLGNEGLESFFQKSIQRRHEQTGISIQELQEFSQALSKECNEK